VLDHSPKKYITQAWMMINEYVLLDRADNATISLGVERRQRFINQTIISI
jgi:hypothetical protein